MRFLWKKDKPAPPNNSFDGIESVNAKKQLRYECYSISETGPTRSGNEDSILCFHPDRQRNNVFAMVADGMGGHLAGEVASRLACEFAAAFIQTHYDKSDTNNTLISLVKQAHLTIADTANKNTQYRGMGTTATLLFIHQKQMYFAHAGDSRLYVLRNGRLQQLTTDHTLVNQWLKEGKITAAEAINHQNKNVITQALGTVQEIHPETGPEDFVVQNNDRYFLCSDGIYDVLTDAELEDLIKMRNPKMTMDCIRLLCTDRVAADNFSAILVTVTEKEMAAAAGITKEQNVPA